MRLSFSRFQRLASNFWYQEIVAEGFGASAPRQKTLTGRFGRPPSPPVEVAAHYSFAAPSTSVGPPFESFRCTEELGAAGFEPATYWSQTSRSTKLSHAPMIFSIPAYALLPRP